MSREELEHCLTVPLETLKKVGMFDLFPAEEWVSGKSAGRVFVGRKAVEMGHRGCLKSFLACEG